MGEWETRAPQKSLTGHWDSLCLQAGRHLRTPWGLCANCQLGRPRVQGSAHGRPAEPTFHLIFWGKLSGTTYWYKYFRRWAWTFCVLIGQSRENVYTDWCVHTKLLYVDFNVYRHRRYACVLPLYRHLSGSLHVSLCANMCACMCVHMHAHLGKESLGVSI